MKYQIVYADPPWRYDFSKDNSDTIENHYPTMSVEEICALDIPSADNSVLYLWATAPKLVEAMQVMKAWGFTYKTTTGARYSSKDLNWNGLTLLEI